MSSKSQEDLTRVSRDGNRPQLWWKNTKNTINRNPSRKSKKRAIEKISTINTNAKRTHNNQEIAPSDDLNDLLINTDVSQSKSTKNTSKRGRKKKVQETEVTDNRESNITKGTKQSYKDYKGKKVVIPQPQIINELLNDSDSPNEDDNDVPNEGNNNGLNENDIENDNDVPNEDGDKAYETIIPSRPIPILEKEATR